ncbi:hypothetical protein JL720_17105 [Aureococcus anophagefferens]|nr:hypothetical protein JL720_17105 [Aureococcus anophagefferens]
MRRRPGDGRKRMRLTQSPWDQMGAGFTDQGFAEYHFSLKTRSVYRCRTARASSSTHFNMPPKPWFCPGRHCKRHGAYREGDPWTSAGAATSAMPLVEIKSSHALPTVIAAPQHGYSSYTFFEPPPGEDEIVYGARKNSKQQGSVCYGSSIVLLLTPLMTVLSACFFVLDRSSLLHVWEKSRARAARRATADWAT